jgi:hypothetical protein
MYRAINSLFKKTGNKMLLNQISRNSLLKSTLGLTNITHRSFTEKFEKMQRSDGTSSSRPMSRVKF